ncbi:XRE family transcriptional regulator [Rhodococcus sp. G-MC3]|uniref:helix-turn-helix domain-containing protein n=1 Tax=Rhodococcus sp. G-MC3 TaxID=3046209 RepID=UPI0024B9BF6C|nr:XRE family transcriptional regulator [Rhodococcus sp. G-MC3]MDJ0396512.1 XRE family transcriptional regulator [Rhodococcus sp. G-MC3]
MGSGVEDVMAAVGPRLRALRSQRGLTLLELAARTGVSQSTLSRLESGLRRPSLDLLLPLAEAYGVALDEVVGAPRTGDPRIHLQPIHRAGLTFIPLTRRAGGVQSYKMVIPKRKSTTRPGLKTHEGYEWLYVLNGQLHLALDDNEFVLSPGDAAEFDTSRPHALDSADGAAVELLILFGMHGERVHVGPSPS